MKKKRIYLTDRSVLSRKILINEISTSVCVSLCEYVCTPLSQLSFVRSRYANHDSSRKTRVERCKAACGNSKVRAFARSRHSNYLGWKLSIRRSFCPRMNEILRNCNRGLPPRFVGQWVIVLNAFPVNLRVLVFTVRSFRNPKDIARFAQRVGWTVFAGCTPNVRDVRGIFHSGRVWRRVLGRREEMDRCSRESRTKFSGSFGSRGWLET